MSNNKIVTQQNRSLVRETSQTINSAVNTNGSFVPRHVAVGTSRAVSANLFSYEALIMRALFVKKSEVIYLSKLSGKRLEEEIQRMKNDREAAVRKIEAIMCDAHKKIRDKRTAQTWAMLDDMKRGKVPQIEAPPIAAGSVSQ